MHRKYGKANQILYIYYTKKLGVQGQDQDQDSY